MTLPTVQISILGKAVQARAGETIVHALWAAGMGNLVQTGCAGGVCGACTVTIAFKDGRKGGADLACMRPVEEGMEVFPCPVESIPSGTPAVDPSLDLLRAAYPTLNRCTKCGSCTSVCPMSIPVMESVLRMQSGQFETVAEDFTTCIHCGLCRMVCEDKVKPHNMGMWVRRSLGISRDYPVLDQYLAETADGIQPDEKANREWAYLLVEDPQERLARAIAFREKGGI